MLSWFNQGVHSFDGRLNNGALKCRDFSTKKLSVSIYLFHAAPFSDGA